MDDAAGEVFLVKRSLPYPINAERPARNRSKSILEVIGLIRSGTEVPISRARAPRSIDSTTVLYDISLSICSVCHYLLLTCCHVTHQPALVWRLSWHDLVGAYWCFTSWQHLNSYADGLVDYMHHKVPSPKLFIQLYMWSIAHYVNICRRELSKVTIGRTGGFCTTQSNSKSPRSQTVDIAIYMCVVYNAICEYKGSEANYLRSY